MSKNTTETEVKIYVANLDATRDKLESIGATLVHERVYERNMRYDDADGKLTETGVVLRLREDSAVKLTYKEPATLERGIMTREEIEVEVSDYDAMESILAKFGFQPAMFYEKYRTTYALDNTEIVLDELPYGTFVEVEGDSIDAIEATLAKLDMLDAERRSHSYAKLFDFVKHHRELTFRDLTFENFADIEVTEADFIPPGSIVIG